MKKAVKQVIIKAPAKKIFDFISNPKNMAIVIPHVIRNYNLSKGPYKPGYTFDWEFSMMGVPFKGKWTITEYDVPKRYVAETEGMIKSKWVYSFSQNSGATTWRATVEYQTPKKLLSKFAETTIHKINEKDLVAFMNNVKTIMEG